MLEDARGREGGGAQGLGESTPTIVAHTVLSAEVLAEELAQRYAFSGPPRTHLLFRGMNDVYAVRDDRCRYALRAWRAHWRTTAEIRYELSFLTFLRQRRFPAAYPVPDRQGNLSFSVAAPEGERVLALYEWAPGVKFQDEGSLTSARQIGQKLAELHLLGAEFPLPASAPDLRFGTLLEDLPYLLELGAERLRDVADYPGLARKVQEFLERLTSENAEALPYGPCHGDLHAGNVHIDHDKTATFLDFDGCGVGFWLQDLANFLFGRAFYRMAPALDAAFLRGYGEIRPLTSVEAGHLEVFIGIKTFQLAAGIARNVNAVGCGSLRYRDLDWFSSELRSRLQTL